jgi:hypothetical protein
VGSRAYSVINAAITVNPVTLPAAMIGAAYSQSVAATGGSGTFTYAITAGALPVGIALNSVNGLVSGTPTAGGTANFTVTATDTLGATGSRAYSVPVNSAMALNPTTLSAGVVGTAYSQSMSATGGSGAYTYTVTSAPAAGSQSQHNNRRVERNRNGSRHQHLHDHGELTRLAQALHAAIRCRSMLP